MIANTQLHHDGIQNSAANKLMQKRNNYSMPMKGSKRICIKHVMLDLGLHQAGTHGLCWVDIEEGRGEMSAGTHGLSWVDIEEGRGDIEEGGEK